MLKAVLEWLMELLFPSHANCLACGKHRIGASGPALCNDCKSRLTALRMPQNVCVRCGHILPVRGCDYCKTGMTKHITWMRAPYPYRDEAARLIRRLKYAGVDAAGAILVLDMAEAFLQGNPPEVDIVTYVPMHERRERYLGVNHAHMLCREAAHRLGLPYSGLLAAAGTMRKRQAKLKKTERLRNRKDAYYVTGPVQSLRVLLVDDVLTTGATAAACAKALLKAGAASVSVLCAAFT